MNVVDWVLAIGAILTALGVLWVFIRRAWKVFGWHGKFWSWMNAFVKTVDVITVLPQKFADLAAKDQEKLVAIEKVRTDLLAADAEKLRLITNLDNKFDAHLEETRVGRDEWDSMKGTLHELVSGVGEIRYEVKNNGGGSLKDQNDRIERGVAGLYAAPGEPGSPGRADHREAAGPTGPNAEIRVAVRARRGRKSNPPTGPVPVTG